MNREEALKQTPAPWHYDDVPCCDCGNTETREEIDGYRSCPVCGLPRECPACGSDKLHIEHYPDGRPDNPLNDLSVFHCSACNFSRSYQEISYDTCPLCTSEHIEIVQYLLQEDQRWNYWRCWDCWHTWPDKAGVHYNKPYDLHPTAKLWVWENGGPILLKLRPNKGYVWSTGGPTDEGFNSEHNSWYYETDDNDPTQDRIIHTYFTRGRDCDGPHESTSKAYVYVKDIWPGHECPRDLEWHEAGSHQRDYYAEAMGY